LKKIIVFIYFWAFVTQTKAQNIFITNSIGKNQLGTGDITGLGVSIGVEKKAEKFLSVGINFDSFSANKEYVFFDLNNKLVESLRIGTRYAGVRPYISLETPKLWRFTAFINLGGFIYRARYANPTQFGFSTITLKNSNEVYVFTSISDPYPKKRFSLGGDASSGIRYYFNKKINVGYQYGLKYDINSEIILNSYISFQYGI
jgi:hypothetical protein